LVSILQTIWTFCKRKPIGAVSAAIILLLILMAAIGPSIAPYDPDAGNAARVLKGPALAYPMGNDQVGRDILSRIMYGARVSLQVSLMSVVFGSLVGVIIGTVSAYFEGWFDAVLQRFVDALLAIPLIVIAIMLVSLVSPTLNNLIVALAISIAPRASRVARGSALAVKHEQYVDAARAIGATDTRIIARYIFPNIFAPILVLFTVTMGAAITAEASLAFLGLGPSTLISWGRMLSAEGRQYMQVAWWMAVYPGLTIMLAVLAFNMFGDALRDVLDPRLRGSR
jgi:peptide/nickel transport system permease protein